MIKKKLFFVQLSTTVIKKFLYTYIFILHNLFSLQVKLEERCKMEMESHKQLLDKEYETLLQQFSKDLEKLQLRHLQELERKLKQNQNAEKKLHKEITSRQEADRKALEAQQKREYKVRCYWHKKNQYV